MLKDLKSAWSFASTLINTCKKNPLVLCLSAAVLVLSGDVSTSLKGLKLYERCLTLYPDFTIATLSISDVYIRQKQYSKGIAVCEKCLSGKNDANDNVTLRKTVRSEDLVHVKLATLHALNHDVHKAIEHYQIALKISPGFAPALQGLAKLDADLKNGDAGQTEVLDNMNR